MDETDRALLLAGYPNLEKARSQEYVFFDIGDGYTGGSIQSSVSSKKDPIQEQLLAWDKQGNVIFAGRIIYSEGDIILGPVMGTFVRAKGHEKHSIGLKMTLVGLHQFQSVIDNHKLPLRQIFAQTQNPTMIDNLTQIGLKPCNKTGGYNTLSFPNISPLMSKYNITQKK